MKYLDPEWTKGLFMPSKMTNRGRALSLQNSFRAIGTQIIGQSEIDLIERALDEAEKRGFQDSQKDFFEIPAYKLGRIEGQREMRERAGMFLKNNGDSMAADAIRALPIEGEEKKA